MAGRAAPSAAGVGEETDSEPFSSETRAGSRGAGLRALGVDTGKEAGF